MLYHKIRHSFRYDMDFADLIIPKGSAFLFVKEPIVWPIRAVFMRTSQGNPYGKFESLMVVTVEK